MAAVLSGCAGHSGDDARLDAIQSRIRSAQVEQRRVEGQLEHSRCQAQLAEIEAAAARVRAGCELRHAEHLRCVAAAERGRSNQTMVGCGIGALITGGVGLLLCGASAVLAPSARCETHPDCERTDEDTTNEALRSLGLDEAPNCDVAE